jgi:AcrR family transcriptional regulator
LTDCFSSCRNGVVSESTRDALLDAAERLLVTDGPAALTTRRIAEEAAQSHGLIRYHFGSLEQLLVHTLERATDRILERQRQLYAGDEPFIEKWRTAMGYLETDVESGGFPKLAAEMIALSYNQPAYRPAVQRAMEGFTEMLTEAVRAALDDYDLDGVDVDAVATLIRTFQLGMMADRLAGIDTGHAVLLDAIDRWLSSLPRRSPA